MANTVNDEILITQVTLDGTTDWDSAPLYPRGMSITHILFYPSAANDVLFVRHGPTGPVVLAVKDVAGRGVMSRLPGNNIQPYIVSSECTLDTPANAVITFFQS